MNDSANDNWGVDTPEALEPSAVIEPAPAEGPPSPRRILEAFLFVGGRPLTAATAGEAIRGLTAEQFVEAIAELNRDYKQQGRPYTIQPRERGYVLALRPRFRPVMEKLYGTVREARLSPPAVDVLALV